MALEKLSSDFYNKQINILKNKLKRKRDCEMNFGPMLIILALERQRQEDLYRFKAILVNIVSFRPAKNIQCLKIEV